MNQRLKHNFDTTTNKLQICIKYDINNNDYNCNNNPQCKWMCNSADSIYLSEFNYTCVEWIMLMLVFNKLINENERWQNKLKSKRDLHVKHKRRVKER